jgi:hypothetical protein
VSSNIDEKWSARDNKDANKKAVDFDVARENRPGPTSGIFCGSRSTVEDCARTEEKAAPRSPDDQSCVKRLHHI